jgi:hypothetical protein
MSALERPTCEKCSWPLVLVAGPGLDVQISPDVLTLPPLACATGMTEEQVATYVWKREWQCRWCSLGHCRLARLDQCPYCGRPWETAEHDEFPSGEPRIRLKCLCRFQAEWYPARGWGKTDDYRLNPMVAARWQDLAPDPGVCEWCGDTAFEFVHRPDGFFRRCLRCQGIHRW